MTEEIKTEKQKPWIIVTVGLPGSGKSSWITGELVPYLAESGIYADVLSTDDIIAHVASVVNKNYTQVFKELIDPAVKVIDSRLFLSSYMKMNIILDQTNLTVKSRKHKLATMHDSDDYFKMAIVFDEPSNVIYERNIGREKTGKMIDSKVIVDMLNRFENVSALESFDDILTPKEFKLKYMPKIQKEETDESTSA